MGYDDLERRIEILEEKSGKWDTAATMAMVFIGIVIFKIGQDVWNWLF